MSFALRPPGVSRMAELDREIREGRGDRRPQAPHESSFDANPPRLPQFRQTDQPPKLCVECASRICHHVTGRPRTLTPREQELLVYLSNGLSNKEIAHQMGISLGSVKVYCSHVLRALGVTSRFEAGLWARDHRDLLGGVA